MRGAVAGSGPLTGIDTSSLVEGATGWRGNPIERAPSWQRFDPGR